MTGPDHSVDVPAILARLLTEPDLLDALARRDFAVLRRDVTAEPAALNAIAAIDVAAFRFYHRRLQRKRLEGVEHIFPASLPAARSAYGADALAADFWQWYQPSATASAPEVPAMVAAAWTGFTGRLSQLGPLRWLGDLSRYEVMRWRAISATGSPPQPHQEVTGKPVLAEGTGVDMFRVDAPALLRTALEGDPVPSWVTTRLIAWRLPIGGIRIARLGAAVYEAVLACDGSRTIDQAAAQVAAAQPESTARLAGALQDLVRAGALRMPARSGTSSEQQDSGIVQPADGA